MITLERFEELENINFDGVDLIMWDMDGTLVATEDLNIQAVHQLLPMTDISTQELESKIHGVDDEAAYYMLEKYLPFDNFEQFKKSKNKIFQELVAQNSEQIMNPRIKDFLFSLAQGPIPMVLVTSSTQDMMEFILRTCEIYDLFKYHRCFEDNDGDNKPSPYPYLETLKHMNIPKQRAVIFEDSQVGLAAADAANVKQVYKVTWYAS